ncbi:helix-turn-helix domain-containing protein [Methylomonas sp. SURF-2]|uniref:Helix-turn-helix domain-containing protein n=1 Tax=Methylomonas subterranea TaxID=2952225 RepID=A0ABT1TGV8_9GAMM|nr:helix-turn-helix domain-containing protein [Methylomonas sp. SURF-2]MCQ8104692.1 helix-turn-helix domain-containing protein [Methylomonas sp. SURF-2]
MKSIENYMDELKEKTGSDNKTALLLGVDRSVISKIKSRGAISDENAVKVAELLDIDPGEVLLAAAMARSQGAVKSAWESVSKRAGIAASLALALLIFQPTNDAAQFDNLYIMRSHAAGCA